MRSRLARIVIFATMGLLAGHMPTYAQQADATVVPELQDQSYCSLNTQPSGPEVSIDNVTFSGSPFMPISDQDEIAASIRQETHGDDLEGVTEEALERARAGWQDRGYAQVEVSGITKTLTSNVADLHIALFVHVDEGLRYNLGGIMFKHNKAISNSKALRGLFAINDGEIFSRQKLAKGLKNLRRLMASMAISTSQRFPLPRLRTKRSWPSSKSTWTRASSLPSGASTSLGLTNLLSSRY